MSSSEDASKYAYVNETFQKLAKKFMPGPLTVIIPKKDTIPDTVTAGLDSVAIRVPIHETARKLIKLSGKPIAAPSANLSGKPSPTTAAHVIADLAGRVDGILCGSDSEVGVESTVVKICDDGSVIICRPGKVTLEMLSEVCPNVSIDPAVLSKFDGKPISPGMKYRHYAPRVPVTILVGNEDEIIEFLSDKTAFGVLCYNEDKKLLTLPNAVSFGASRDHSEQAHLLFDRLRYMDTLNDIEHIYARMPSTDGVGLAVYNRLIKAAGFSVIHVGK